MSEPLQALARSVLGWGLLWALLVATPLVASAQTASATRQPAFERGLRELQFGTPDGAAKAFEEALEHTPEAQAGPAWLNLGIARARQNRPHAAVTAFDSYLRLADPARETANIRAVEAEIQRLRVTSTVLVLAITPADAAVRVDGRPVTPRHGELWLSPGIHEITLHAPGFVTHQQEVTLPAGRFQFALAMTPGASKVPPAVAEPEAAAPSPSDATASVAEGPTADASGTPADTEDGDADEEGNGCLLDDVCFGPLVSVGAPNAIGGALHGRFGDYVSANLSIDVLPQITVSGVDVSTELLSARVQVHPLGNGLFASLGLGVQNIVANVQRPEGSGRADLNIPVMGLGFGYIGRDGLVLGIDFSFLIELENPPLEVVINGGDVDPALQAILEQEANDTVQQVRDMLPFMFQLNLLRFGYLF